MSKFKFRLFTNDNPQAKYEAVSPKDPMTFYLLNNGVGYLGETKLFDATSDGLVQVIEDTNTSLTDAASVNAIVKYVAGKMEAINALNIKFFRSVEHHVLKAEDFENEHIQIPEDASEGDIGLLFTVDNNNDEDEGDEFFFISLMNYLQTMHTFVSGKTVTLTVDENMAVTAEVKIASTETELKAGDDGLFLDKVTAIDEENPTTKLVTESALVSYIQDALSQMVTYSVDEEDESEE